ncbi:hypothetical protein DNTS_009743 [Danionella cerebrum]|uniref:EGF-like domain-containing protein n=1 Tax=Danionella cerebrum TaxID=2873325 RepID=A0A553RNJ0_9TELE|nr:hypothetical protein DNTS_009743 [Danionella translucida]
MMETCVRRRARRVVFMLVLLVLNALITKAFSTDADTEFPLSSESSNTQTAGVKQTTSWGERVATAPAVHVSSGRGEMTDIPASVSITAARRGYKVDLNTEDWTSMVTTDERFQNSEFTHNTTSQWEHSSVGSHSTTKHNQLTEPRTVRGLPATDLRPIDTYSTSHTDSTYISTTNRVGERTLLSIISNSTSTYTEDSNSSDAVSQSFTWKEKTSEVTQDIVKHGKGVSTVFEVTSEHHNGTSATQSLSLETKQPTKSQGHESHTRQPSVTRETFEEMTVNDSPNSTPPLTVISRGPEETSVSSGISSIETTDSISSFIAHNATSISHKSRNSTQNYPMQTGTSTEYSTGLTDFTSHVDPKGSSTHLMAEATIQGLTVAPPVLGDVATTTDESISRFPSGQPPIIKKTDNQINTEVMPTSASPATQKPQATEQATEEASTVYSFTRSFTTATVNTLQPQPSTTAQIQTEHSSIVTTNIVQIQQTTASTSHHMASTTTTGTNVRTNDSSDVTTLHLETSTATPGKTTQHSGRTTTPFSKSSPTRSTEVETIENHTDRSYTEMGITTTQMPYRTSASPGHVCGPTSCANGGRCVRSGEGSTYCQCLLAWTGPFCTEDVDECVNNPCPQGSVCMNTGGSFTCECALGSDLEDGRSCTQGSIIFGLFYPAVKTFLGTFTVNNSMLRNPGLHELHREIQQLLNASLSIFHGYRHSTLGKRDGDGVQIPVVNMFSLSSDVTSADVFHSIQMSLNNCSRTYSHCTIKLRHQLSYHVEDLCLAQKTQCDSNYSDCTDASGIPYCQCHPGYFKQNPGDMTCRDCGDGRKLVDVYKLIAVVVSPVGGALLLIVLIALIVTCCKKDKNDINKIIFKSGELQMSPYPEFPKGNRVSMEWGRETIEMQENGSTKNLLQMTDIYYSPALRNADLERNGLYPFSGLPGSRHSCIYPAQWNPSFISDDSRRRDYF